MTTFFFWRVTCGLNGRILQWLLIALFSGQLARSGSEGKQKPGLAEIDAPTPEESQYRAYGKAFQVFERAPGNRCYLCIQAAAMRNHQLEEANEETMPELGAQAAKCHRVAESVSVYALHDPRPRPYIRCTKRSP